MALLDRALAGAEVAVLHSGSLKDHVSGLAVTSTGVQVDPIVSGSNFSYLFNGSAGSKSISITTPSLAGLSEVCLEFYLYMDGSAPFTAVKCGADNLIEFTSTGFATITLPYASGTTQAVVEMTPEDVTQFSINMTGSSWSVHVDGIMVRSGRAPVNSFKNLSSVSMTSPSAGTLVFGAFLMYTKTQGDSGIQSRMVEAVFATPDPYANFDFMNYEFSDFSQNFVVKYDIPKSYPWSDYLTSGVTINGTSLALDLSVVETYDDSINAYCTNRAYLKWGSNSGQAHVHIPSYTASATNRGIVHLRTGIPGLDEFALRFNTGNRLELLRTVWSTDSNGVDTSTITTTLMSTPASAITGSSTVNVGFGWDPIGLYVVYGSTATLVSNTAGVPIGQYEVVFGNTRSAVGGVFDQPYFASQDEWTWQLRLWRDFDSSSPTISPTSYGNHTFFTADFNKEVPVMAEAQVNIDVPLPPDETIRQPYLYIDGQPESVVESVL